ncbi:MAG: FAD-dependent oxidoreductase [Halobacteria archaeon]
MIEDTITENLSAGRDRALVSGIAGIIPGIILTLVLPLYMSLPIGIILGAIYGILFLPTEGTLVDHVTNGASLSIPGWLIIQLTVSPWILSGAPAWRLTDIKKLFPVLGVWVIAGTTLSVIVPVAGYYAEEMGYIDLERYRYGSLSDVESKKILILGGGFAGLYAAKKLEEKFGPNPGVEIKLVSDDNSVLFTPMLPEVAGGTLDSMDVTVPIRTSLRRTEIREASAIDLDFENNKVYVEDELRINPEFSHFSTDSPGPEKEKEKTGDDEVEEDEVEADEPVNNGDGVSVGDTPKATEQEDGGEDVSIDEDSDESRTGIGVNVEELEYDELLLTLGATPDHHGIEGIDKFAFDFKTIQDAMSIRNHVVSCLERAAMEDDAYVRESLLTFVIAGGGFAGAELAGAVNDLVRGMLSYYPNVPEEEVDVVLVHSRERILPELSEELGEEAKKSMSNRGVRFVLNVYVDDADPEQGKVMLTSGESITAQTLVWTAGNQPHPLISETDLPTKHGAADVDEYLNIPEYDNVWAAGDCAYVVDAKSGEPHPPTAQHAIRESKDMAANVYRKTTGEEMKPHSYSTQGMLCVIGHQAACAEIGNFRFTGLFAWLMWRMIYLMKLPGLDRKIRVFFKWTVDLFFPPDIVQTLGSKTREVMKDDW